MTHTLTFAMEDVSMLYHTSVSVSDVPKDEVSGRFQYARRSDRANMADLELASPAYEKGSMLWSDSAGSALILAKLLMAEGYEAVNFIDGGADNSEGFNVVLTSWSHLSLDVPLTDEPVVIDIFINGADDVPIDVTMGAFTAGVARLSNCTFIADPTVEDHDDHYHVAAIIQLPGTAISGLMKDVAEHVPVAIGYRVVSKGL